MVSKLENPPLSPLNWLAFICFLIGADQKYAFGETGFLPKSYINRSPPFQAGNEEAA